MYTQMGDSEYLDIYNSVYDSLLYTYIQKGQKEGERATKGYLDVWYGKTADDKLEEQVDKFKRGGWFSNPDYQATQPAFRLLCEKGTPYRDLKKICRMDNIMDKDPYVSPFTMEGKIVMFIIFAVSFFSFSQMFGLIKPKKYNQRGRRR